MKPWLFDILACPIDKAYPLKLYIFSFETKIDEFQSFIEIYEKRDIDIIKAEKIIEISSEDGILHIKDNIVIEKKPIEEYFKLIISSINELTNIYDKTPYDISKRCLNIILIEIKEKLLEFSKDLNINNIENILPELFLINKFKIETEIETGLLFCEKCKRWFPIIETIPQMLPDEYRVRKQEVQFLKSNVNLLDQELLNHELKPFKIYKENENKNCLNCGKSIPLEANICPYCGYNY